MNLKRNTKLFFTKVKKSENEDDLNNLIFNKLEDPKDYFQLDNYVLGKINTRHHSDIKNKLIPYSFVGAQDDLLYSDKVRRGSFKSFMQSGTQSIDSRLYQNSPSTEKNYRIIKEKEIGEMYLRAKKRENEDPGFEMDRLPKILKRSLANQEKSLNLTKDQFYEENLIMNKISKEIKKSKSELLMNRYEEYRKKKEERDVKSVDENLGMFAWVLSLRKSNVPEENNSTYLNIGKPHLPLYQFIKESPSSLNKLETIRNPAKSKDNKAFMIKGKNLIEEEISVVKNMKGRKLLFNDEERRINKFELIDQKYESFRKSFLRRGSQVLKSK